MPFFKNVFKSKDGPRSASKAANHDEPAAKPKPRWEESWSRKEVAPEDIQELIHGCTQEMKSRGMHTPDWAVRDPLLTRQQPWICPSYCSPSAPHPIPALLAISYATFSRPTTKGPANTEARAWRLNCASLSHWYDTPRRPNAVYSTDA